MIVLMVKDKIEHDECRQVRKEGGRNITCLTEKFKKVIPLEIVLFSQNSTHCSLQDTPFPFS